MTYISKSSFSLEVKAKSFIFPSSKILSWYISLTTSIYLSSLSNQLWIFPWINNIILLNLSCQYSSVSFNSFIFDFKKDISSSLSLIKLFNLLILKFRASLFSVRVLILSFLSFICSSTFVKVVDRVCILSYYLLILSTLLIKSINDSLSSFDNI